MFKIIEKKFDCGRRFCELVSAHGKEQQQNTTMKKTLLIAAAALAAGIMTSQAQVYSQNIVGYVNKPAPVGYVNVANPFDAGLNTLTNIIDNSAGAWNYTLVYRYTGTGFETYTMDNAFPTGVGDPTDSFGVPSPIFAPGSAFFFFNNTGASNTLTMVGTVHKDGTGAGTVGLTTNVLASGSRFIGSVLPVGGNLGTTLQLTNSGTSIDYTLIQIPVINGVGNITGFSTVTVDSGFPPTGFGDATDSFAVPEPVIPVASGFFFNNNTGSPKQWTQAL